MGDAAPVSSKRPIETDVNPLFLESLIDAGKVLCTISNLRGAEGPLINHGQIAWHAIPAFANSARRAEDVGGCLLH